MGKRKKPNRKSVPKKRVKNKGKKHVGSVRPLRRNGREKSTRIRPNIVRRLLPKLGKPTKGKNSKANLPKKKSARFATKKTTKSKSLNVKRANPQNRKRNKAKATNKPKNKSLKVARRFAGTRKRKIFKRGNEKRVSRSLLDRQAVAKRRREYKRAEAGETVIGFECDLALVHAAESKLKKIGKKWKGKRGYRQTKEILFHGAVGHTGFVYEYYSFEPASFDLETFQNFISEIENRLGYHAPPSDLAWRMHLRWQATLERDMLPGEESGEDDIEDDETENGGVIRYQSEASTSHLAAIQDNCCPVLTQFSDWIMDIRQRNGSTGGRIISIDKLWVVITRPDTGTVKKYTPARHVKPGTLRPKKVKKKASKKFKGKAKRNGQAKGKRRIRHTGH